MKYLINLLFILLFTNGLFAIEYKTDLTNPESYNIVDKLNEYDLQYKILELYSTVLKDSRSKIFYEFHLGSGGFVNQSNENYMVSCKLNLNNPKIAKTAELNAKVAQLKKYLDIRPLSFSNEMNGELIKIENDLKEYENKTFPSRYSIGFSFPFLSYSTYDNSNLLSYKPSIFNPIIFLGIDYADLLTLQFGTQIRGPIFIGISLDISTPVYETAKSFFSNLNNFFSGQGYRYNTL